MAGCPGTPVLSLPSACTLQKDTLMKMAQSGLPFGLSTDWAMCSLFSTFAWTKCTVGVADVLIITCKS